MRRAGPHREGLPHQQRLWRGRRREVRRRRRRRRRPLLLQLRRARPHLPRLHQV
ncbi:hypothetical protein CFC21_086713, partial [Triticum aestivum]